MRREDWRRSLACRLRAVGLRQVLVEMSVEAELVGEPVLGPLYELIGRAPIGSAAQVAAQERELREPR